MADYKLSLLALNDLNNITEYTAITFGERQARTYAGQIHASATAACNFPSLGGIYTTAQGSGFRKYNVGRHALFYRPTAAGIFIVRILHLMTDFDRHLD